MFDWLIDWVLSLWNTSISWLNSAISALTGWLNSAINGVKSWALATFAKIGSIASTIWNYITNVYNTVSNYITNVYNTVSNYITNVINNIVNYISNTYNTIVNNITQVIGVTIEKVAEWFASIGGATKAWAEGLFVKANNVWNSITGDLGKWWKTQLALINETFGWVQDFRDGLTKFFGDVPGFIQSRVIEPFVDAFNNGFDRGMKGGGK